MNFHDLPALAAAHRGLKPRFAFADLTVTLRAGERAWTLTVRDGEVAVADGAAAASDFTLAAPQSAWAAFAEARPPVGFQTLRAMATAGHLRTEGPRTLQFVRHQMGFEMLFQGLRASSGPPPAAPPESPPEIEPIVGRYMRMSIGGVAHRVYFEEAGAGVPLLCLHTAGSDGRQYRALLNDPEVTRRFRVVVFDLPAHGKSSPPEGYQDRTHVLTTDSYVATVMAFKAALCLERPVVMGCSIGGRAVLHLALRHGEQFRAAIGLQSATHAENHGFPELDDQGVLSRPDINVGDVSASSVWQLMGPNTPSRERWETLWHYMQAAPNVFAGDLVYYFADGDLRNGLAEPLRDGPCPIYLLSGEYDLSATPEMTAELARQINPRHFEVMKGLGHFPMSEDPETFRTYLLPVLARIEGDAA